MMAVTFVSHFTQSEAVFGMFRGRFRHVLDHLIGVWGRKMNRLDNSFDLVCVDFL